jgi:hypothetical protein
MLFDTVEFLSPQSTLVNPVIKGEMTQVEPVAPSQPTSTVPKQYVDNAISNVAIYDVGCFSQGKPEASSALLKLVSPRNFELPAGLAGSIAKAATGANAQAVFSIKKNGVQVGTLTFAAAATSGTFSSASIQTIGVGDVLEISSPASQDSSLSDIAVTLAGTLINQAAA